MNSHFKFPRRVRIHGGECGAVARALHHEAQKVALTQNEQMFSSDVKGLMRQADRKKSLRSTLIERKQMSTKTSIKRIALVAVSALGFGLLSVMPAKAAAANVGYTTASATMHRTDAAADSTFTIEAKAALTIADDKDITLAFKRNDVAISGVPAGITLDWDDTNTDAVGGTGNAGNVLDAEMGQANFASGDDIVVVTVGRTMAPGKYTVSLTVETAFVDATSLTFYVSTAPATLALDAASYVLDATDSLPNATLTIKDAQGNPTYLITGESLDVTVTGTGATKPTVSPGFLDSNGYDNNDADKTLDLETSGATVGAYTLTVARASGLTGLASATAALTVGTTPSVATGLKIASGTYVNSVDAVGDNGTDSNYDGANDLIVLGAANNGFAYLSTAAKSLTFTASTAATSGTMRWTIAATGGGVTGLPAGVTAATTDVAIVQNAAGTYESSFTVTSTAPAATYGYTVTVESGANDFGFQVVYQAPVASLITTVDSTIKDGNIAAQKGDTTSIEVVTNDQFGQPIGGAGITFATTGRQASSAGSVSATDGKATYTYKDASTATVASAPTDSFTASLASPINTAGYVEDNSVGVTVNYSESLAAATVTLVTHYDTTTGAGSSVAYDGAIAAAGTSALTVSANSAIETHGATDQVIMQATVKQADGTVVPYAKVTFTGSAGVYVAAADTASLTSNATVVPVLAAGVTTITVYANGSGVAYAQARFTKAGSGSVTAASLGATSTPGTVTVSSSTDQRFIDASISGNIVSAVVTDGFGNQVSGVTVTFTVSNGTFLTGANLVTGATDSAGKSTAALATGTGLSVKAAISGGQSAAAADANVTGFAAGIASETVVTDSVTAEQTAAQAAYDAALEAIDAATAAEEAAFEAIAAADAATLAAEEAKASADAATTAIEELSSQVATLMAALQAQITTLANTVAKILKRLPKK